MDLAAIPAPPHLPPHLALKLALLPLSATTPRIPLAASPPTCQATVEKAEKTKAAVGPPKVITRVLRCSIFAAAAAAAAPPAAAAARLRV